MGALKKDGVPTYKVKIQQQGRENLWLAKGKKKRARIQAPAANLPTSPELWLMIKLQLILKPIQESVKQEQLPILQDIKNESNNILKPATKMLQPSTYLVAEERWDRAHD